MTAEQFAEFAGRVSATTDADIGSVGFTAVTATRRKAQLRAQCADIETRTIPVGTVSITWARRHAFPTAQGFRGGSPVLGRPD